ncbi:MAG: hypothetical protein IT510_05405 [Sulfuritalea sp.]|nr:hypothetical protein [Sulfuritalea sp.]
MTSLNHRDMRCWPKAALWAAGGGVLLALLAAIAVLVWLKWDDWFWQRKFLFTAEQQLVDLALRNPVSGTTPPGSFVGETRSADYNCRIVSTARNVEINPLACSWRYGRSIQAYLGTGTVVELTVSGSGARNPNHLQAFHDGAGDRWEIFLGTEVGESAGVQRLVAAAGAVPLERNQPILRASADCPVTIASSNELYARIEAIGGLLETEATGTRDADRDIGRGVRRLHLSSDTVNQVACVLARALAPYKIDVVIQSPPMGHYITGYLDHYNERMWQAAREVVGSGFEVMVWSILDRR